MDMEKLQNVAFALFGVCVIFIIALIIGQTNEKNDRIFECDKMGGIYVVAKGSNPLCIKPDAIIKEWK